MSQAIGVVTAIVMWLAFAPGAPTASGFEGTWTATVPGPSGQSGLPVTFVLHVSDSDASGTVSTNERTFALVDLKIDGQAIVFAIEGEEQNRFSGTLAGDVVRMQVKYPSHENGTRTWSFVMKRAPARAVDARAVEGDWDGEVPRGSGRTIEARFSFRIDGGALGGTVHAVGDDFSIVKGTIDGMTIAFKVAGTEGDYSGTVGADEIRMKVKYDGGESGRQTLPFVLTRVR
jgi:hypothetical protein